MMSDICLLHVQSGQIRLLRFPLGLRAWRTVGENSTGEHRDRTGRGSRLLGVPLDLPDFFAVFSPAPALCSWLGDCTWSLSRPPGKLYIRAKMLESGCPSPSLWGAEPDGFRPLPSTQQRTGSDGSPTLSILPSCPTSSAASGTLP